MFDQVQPGDTWEMVLIAKKAASLFFVIPLRPGEEKSERSGAE